jgi:pimeloyl-ACP methyl ester carboxylesterase
VTHPDTSAAPSASPEPGAADALARARGHILTPAAAVRPASPRALRPLADGISARRAGHGATDGSDLRRGREAAQAQCDLKVEGTICVPPARPEDAVDALEALVQRVGVDVEPLRGETMVPIDGEIDLEGADQLTPAWRHAMEVLAAMARPYPFDTTRALLRDHAVQDRRDVVSRIDVPVLAVGGRHSPLWPVESTVWIAERAPRGELVIMESSGHAPFLEEPDAFNRALLRFLG